MSALRKRDTLLKNTNVKRAPLQTARLVAVNRQPAAKTSRQFPQRPNLRVLSDTIPLFYIGQNSHGLWVARDAEGRTGGLFLRKQSALRFARRQSEPTGCALMLLGEPAELDVENQGNRFAVPLGTAVDVVTRRAPRLAGFAGMVIAEWRKLVAEISYALAGARRHRAAAEHELFHDRYWLLSKNDDDLPVS